MVTIKIRLKIWILYVKCPNDHFWSLPNYGIVETSKITLKKLLYVVCWATSLYLEKVLDLDLKNLPRVIFYTQSLQKCLLWFVFRET